MKLAAGRTVSRSLRSPIGPSVVSTRATLWTVLFSKLRSYSNVARKASCDISSERSHSQDGHRHCEDGDLRAGMTPPQCDSYTERRWTGLRDTVVCRFTRRQTRIDNHFDY
ncbi:hypothetical protein QR680_017370 [Steinernema hermaphroditum]|uniref:Uncharacterized protein n=1 Tax=Steinernema hermaphroditum TaxID=289476 RepID=A0AA39HEA1_9BILA|nr:hypothetical protein QR680_017370 [Steinernema hermaphroditum]